jgi:hypothetical protein
MPNNEAEKLLKEIRADKAKLDTAKTDNPDMPEWRYLELKGRLHIAEATLVAGMADAKPAKSN